MTPIHLRLPATSANVGPGFDAVGLALGLYLTIAARALKGERDFKLTATGRDCVQVGSADGNLLVETYRSLTPDGPALELVIENEIPLGMGLGSSAAALLAGVMLANHFGELGLSQQGVLDEACRREGHPDNVAACLLGGFTVSAVVEDRVRAASIPAENLPWKLFVALPSQGLATKKARALLPERYTRTDAVANVQATGLLVSAFALGRGDLLEVAMQDRLHQPYRGRACPLLPRLLPLAGSKGVLGVSLSGAGPSVLLITEGGLTAEGLELLVRGAAGEEKVELLMMQIARGAETVSGVERRLDAVWDDFFR